MIRKNNRKIIQKAFLCTMTGITVLSLTGCQEKKRKIVTITHAPYEKMAYETTVVQKGDIQPELKLKLRAEGYERITYDATNEDLQLDTVYVSVGDKVEKGDLLVSFQSEKLQQAIDSYKEQYTQNELLAEHYSKLMQIDNTMDYSEDIAKLKQDMEVAELYIEEAEEKMSRYQMIAKESGTITEMNSYLQNGTFVPGNKLITQVCGSGKYQADLPVNYEFHIGERYEATLGQITYELEVSEVNEKTVVFSPVSDMSSVSEADTLTMEIEQPTLSDVVYVDAGAVKEVDEAYFVYVLDEEGYREAVPVTIGEQVAGQIVITGGLSGGEKVTIN